MPSNEAAHKAKACIALLEREQKKIERLIMGGLSVNQLMRKLKVTTDHTIRQWLKKNRPDLFEIITQNGLNRLHRLDIKGVKECQL